MSNNETHDFDFEMSECISDPFKGRLQFTVQKKIKIVSFEFSTHDLGCRRNAERSVKYGLRLKLNGKILFTYHKDNVDAQVKKSLILTPGNTYTLDTWLGGHKAVKSGEKVKPCQYHYAKVSRTTRKSYEPFKFIFSNDGDQKISNTTCVYVISYELLD